MSWLYELSGAGVYYVHAICLTGDPVIIAFYVAGDLTIWGSYTVIGAALLIAGRDAVQPRLSWLYGAFIALCGLSHLTKTATLFAGIYRLDALVVLLTASVSAATAWRTVAQFRRPK